MAFEGMTGWLKHVTGRQAFFPHQMSFILELPTRRHETANARRLARPCRSGRRQVAD